MFRKVTVDVEFLWDQLRLLLYWWKCVVNTVVLIVYYEDEIATPISMSQYNSDLTTMGSSDSIYF